MRRIFITGTDTEIGKTHAACALSRELVRRGHKVAALKPVASGCEVTPDGLRNEDALALMSATNIELDYEQVNPYSFEPAIAPHVAAARSGVSMSPTLVGQIAAPIESDFLVVEGVGGWCVPLGDELMQSDLAGVVCEEVILVVGLRLGCISHALLTAKQIERDGFRLSGWVANTLDPDMPVLADNIDSIEKRLTAPLLAVLPRDDAGIADPQWPGLEDWLIRKD